MISGLPPVQVTASGETQPVGTNRADAADDPAIWVDPANPNHALIVATDKKAGLHVYDLTGKDIAFTEAGLVNNVAVAGDLLVASERNDGDDGAPQMRRAWAWDKVGSVGVMTMGAY